MSSRSVYTTWCHSWTRFDQTRGSPRPKLVHPGPICGHVESMQEEQQGNLPYGWSDNLWIWKLWETLIDLNHLFWAAESPSSEKITEIAHEQQRKGARKRSSIPQVPWSFLLPIFSFLALFHVVHTCDWVSWITPASWDELQQAGFSWFLQLAK